MPIDNIIDNYMVLDQGSGTTFLLANACLIDMSKLSDDERHYFEEGGDSYRRHIGEQYGQAIIPGALLSGTTPPCN